MAYPDKPEQYIVILDDDGNQIDLFDSYGMALLDGWSNPIPDIKTNSIDIPGGNGSIDLTEASFGDVVFNNRASSFPFIIVDVEDKEKKFEEIKSFLHGKTHKYFLSWDTYTNDADEQKYFVYEGRMYVTDETFEKYSNFANWVLFVTISVDAKPFKRQNDAVYEFSAIGGIKKQFISGRKRVPLTVECSNQLKLIDISKNEVYLIPPGTHKLTDVIFHKGINEIYFSSYSLFTKTWGDLMYKTEYYTDYERDENGNIVYSEEVSEDDEDVKTLAPKTKQYERTSRRTWGDMASIPIYELLKDTGKSGLGVRTWGNLISKTYLELQSYKWSELMYIDAEIGKIKDIKVSYEVGEL